MTRYGRLRVRRPHAFIDYFRAYRVMVDGECVGKVHRGETFETGIPVGLREIRLDIDWCSSNSLEVEISETPASLVCGNNWSGWKIFFAWRAVVAHADEYLWLSPET